MATTFPNSIQTFKQFEDITVEDASLVTQYQNAIQQGNISLANQILQRIENYNNKILTALDLNTIVDTCRALQEYYLVAYSPAYIVSASQPPNQEIGDYWFQIIE